MTVNPPRTSRRCGCRLAIRWAIAEEARIPMVAGSSIRPVWIALKCRSCCRKTEMTKNEPCRTSHCTVWVTRPRSDVRFRNRVTDTSGVAPRFSRRLMWTTKAPRNTIPIATRTHTGEMPPSGMRVVPPTVTAFFALPQP